jgi:hypothetical protein
MSTAEAADLADAFKRAMAAFMAGRFADAERHCVEVLDADPDDFDVQRLLAALYVRSGRHPEAIMLYDRILARHPDYAEGHHLRAVALGELGRMPEALNDRDAFAAPQRSFPQPQWNGLQSLYDRTILLHAGSSDADAIQFCRFVPQVAARGAQVILEVALPLRDLMTSLSGVSQVIAAGDPLPGFDLHCPLDRLPHAFGTRLETIPTTVPYLRPPAAALPFWKFLLGVAKRPHIGIAWAGNPADENDRHRSIALRAMLRLVDAGATFISLQKELRSGDETLLETRHDVIHVGDTVGDVTDMAGLAMNLDLIITADTSLAHLAGALGRPAWILLPYAPDWRWLLGRDTSPWYAGARLFRQARPGDWDEVIARVKAVLPGFVATIEVRDPVPHPTCSLTGRNFRHDRKPGRDC